MLRHSNDAQLVVVGSHGRGPLMGALMGSTTQNLMHHARCPVLICRDH
jgi:nucleotide-binding universal stress UspA family protein